MSKSVKQLHKDSLQNNSCPVPRGVLVVIGGKENMGDVMIGRTVDKVLTQKGCAWAWGNMLPMLQQTDFNLANLETALTRCEEKVWKIFNFKASPHKVEGLKLLYNVCNL